MKKSMKKYHKMTVVMLIVGMILTGNYAFAQNQDKLSKSIEKPADKKQILFFNENASVKKIEELVESESLELESFNAEILVDDEVITCGYVVNCQDDFSTLWNDFTEKQTSLLIEALEANKENEEMVGELRALLDAFEADEVKVTNAICSDISIESVLLEKNGIVDNIKEIPVKENVTELEKKNVSSKTETAAATNTWVPNSGTGYAWRSSEYPNAIYLQLDYRWTSAARMTTLTGNPKSTLEGEIVLYNYDGSAIASSWYNHTYTTNQPSPYLDTQFSDGSDEYNFTIGCSYASSMKPDNLYYWFAYGKRTGSNACKAKISFQRGHRLIAENYGDTWNIFADETKAVVTFNEWNTGVNSSKSF